MTGPGLLQNRPGTHEQQGLENRVIEHMEQTAGKTEGRHDRTAGRNPDHAKSCPDQDNTDILDTVVGQQPFDVMLAQGIDDAQDSGDHTDDQHRLAEKQGAIGQQDIEAEDAVDTHLDHHPRHDCRDMAGRGGGGQICSGNIPALEPKPMRARIKTTNLAWAGSWSICSKEKLPVWL